MIAKLRGEVLSLLRVTENGFGYYSKHLLNINKHKVKKHADRTTVWR